jgi:CDP-diacylglycerol--glycerol-3-phosphate 3-phosphatidyltransferase
MATSTSIWPDLGRFWTLANTLSLTRLVLVVPIAVLLWQDGPLGWLLGLTVAAIMTDWFDGRVARWTRTVSEWGKVIDPVADKVAAILVVTVLTFRPEVAGAPELPFWFFGLIVGRDLLILAGGAWIARRSGKVLMSAWAGKAASLWLAITVLSVILKADEPVFQVCLWMATGLFVFSFGVYVVRYLNALRRSPPPRDRPDVSSTSTNGSTEASSASSSVQDASSPKGRHQAQWDPAPLR